MNNYAFAQTSFKLDKKHGHYYMKAPVNNGGEANILLGSRLPGMLVDSKTFDKYFDEANFEKVNSDEKYLGFKNIREVLHGKVTIGDLSYTGKILVLEGDYRFVVPVHLLKNETDSTASLIRLNFKKKILESVERDKYDITGMNSFGTIEFDPMPVFQSTMELADTYGHEGKIQGKFIFDLGNGTPVFLFQKNIARFLKANNFTILNSTDTSLNNVGIGLHAGFCKIGERTHNGISIGITDKLHYNGILGCVGPSFFGNDDVLLDTENGVIFYQ